MKLLCCVFVLTGVHYCFIFKIWRNNTPPFVLVKKKFDSYITISGTRKPVVEIGNFSCRFVSGDAFFTLPVDCVLNDDFYWEFWSSKYITLSVQMLGTVSFGKP